MKTLLSCAVLIFFASCSGANQHAATIPELAGMIITGDTVVTVDGEIRSILQDSKNNMWFATNNDGVFKFDGNSITQFTEKHGLCSDHVWKVQEGKDGKIWFYTNVQHGSKEVRAICYFDGQAFITPALQESAFDPNYNYLQDEVIVDHYYDGKSLVKIQLPYTSLIQDEKASPAQFEIYCSLKDRAGNIWFGTQSTGVCKFDGKNYTSLQDKALGMAVRSIYEDQNGMIWIGNNGNGLFRYDPGKDVLTNFTTSLKLDNNNSSHQGNLTRVWTITDDGGGNLWVGTIDAGVWKLDLKGSNAVTNYTTADGLGIDFIWTILRDKNDKLWFGTDGFGVYTFDGKLFSKFSEVK